MLLSVMQWFLRLNRQEHITLVLALILLSSAEGMMTLRISSPGKGGTFHHTIFGSSSKTSAVNPGFLNAAFSACTAECPGTAGMKAAWCAAGGRLSSIGMWDHIC